VSHDSPAIGPREGDLEIDCEWTTRILCDFLSAELERTGFSRLVVGLSGGIDSAVAAHLAARALGPERLICLLMPYRTSSASSIEHADEVVEQLGVRHERLEITPLIAAFEEIAGETSSHRLGNVMARARMVLLFDRSVKHEALVLGTSNKSELLLGYGTLHGDLASALNPLGDLYKTQVRALAEYLEVPEAIRVKPPSADLWPDQTDELDLGLTYEEIDKALALLIDARMSREAVISRGVPAETVDRLTRMIVRSQFKRVPPLVAKVSTRSMGWDFRYPRDWQS
jgi:NAD+ synthase